MKSSEINSDRKKWRTVTWITCAAIAAGVIMNLRDIKRYIRISSM